MNSDLHSCYDQSLENPTTLIRHTIRQEELTLLIDLTVFPSITKNWYQMQGWLFERFERSSEASVV